MRILLIATMFLVIAQGCKKDANRQYSKWYVNTDSFYTADIRVDKGNAICKMEGNDLNNRYFLTFNVNYLPKDGSFSIRCDGFVSWVCVSIEYKGIGYSSPKNAYLQASSNGGKASYTLEPVWFYNPLNPNDSVLVKGTFNEP